MKWLVSLEEVMSNTLSEPLDIPHYSRDLCDAGVYFTVQGTSHGDVRFDGQRVFFKKDADLAAGLTFEKVIRVVGGSGAGSGPDPLVQHMGFDMISVDGVLRRKRVWALEWGCREAITSEPSKSANQCHEVISSMTGRVVQVSVQPGDRVGPKDCLVVVEAMKMENKVFAGAAGVVRLVKVKVGDRVTATDKLCTVGLDQQDG